MADPIKFSESSTIGLHAMLHLAVHGHEGPIQMKTVAEAYRLSEAHLAKVLQRLGKAGLIRAARGPNGGYTLCRAASEVTLLEVYEAIEGEVGIRTCLLSEAVCTSGCCELGALVGSVQQELRRHLGATTLADWGRQVLQAGTGAVAAVGSLGT